jgi:hypothetical protein
VPSNAAHKIVATRSNGNITAVRVAIAHQRNAERSASFIA